MLRRGVTWRWGLLTGALLIALPIVKATALSLYPVAGLAFLVAVWRHHRRRADLLGWVGLALGALIVQELQVHLSGVFHPVSSTATARHGGGDGGRGPRSAAHTRWASWPTCGSCSCRGCRSWRRTSSASANPAFTIFVERGWGAFGWYDVFFPHWVYLAIAGAMVARAAAGAGRDLPRVAVRAPQRGSTSRCWC